MRAPTAIEMTCANPSSPCALPTGFQGDPDLKAVVATTYEIGARRQSNDGLAWNFALYDTRVRNDIEFVSTNSSQGYFANVGTTERKGLDLGISKKADQWFLSANYGYVDAIYRSAWTNTQGQSVVSGDQIPGIPRESLKLRAAYEFSPGLVAGANVLAVSGQYAHGDEGNQMSPVPGYATVNLDLHYRITDDLLLTGNVSNLFNKKYYTYGVVSSNVYTNANANEIFLTPAPPVAAWIGLTYTFGGKRLNRSDKD
jgi:outer membrane receptor protein involved in Fe transport